MVVVVWFVVGDSWSVTIVRESGFFEAWNELDVSHTNMLPRARLLTSAEGNSPCIYMYNYERKKRTRGYTTTTTKWKKGTQKRGEILLAA